MDNFCNICLRPISELHDSKSFAFLPHWVLCLLSSRKELLVWYRNWPTPFRWCGLDLNIRNQTTLPPCWKALVMFGSKVLLLSVFTISYERFQCSPDCVANSWQICAGASTSKHDRYGIPLREIGQNDAGKLYIFALALSHRFHKY